MLLLYSATVSMAPAATLPSPTTNHSTSSIVLLEIMGNDLAILMAGL